MRLKSAIDSIIHDQVDGYTKHNAKLNLIDAYQNGNISKTKLADLLDTSLFDIENEIERIKTA